MLQISDKIRGLMAWKDYTGLAPGRVTRGERGGCLVATEAGEIACSIALGLHEGENRPVTGDWCAFDEAGVIRAVLPRESLFSRKSAGDGSAIQPIAANVDTAFLVSSLDEDFSVRRLERYVALCRESGVEPVALLTKLDLAEDPQASVEAVRQAWPDIKVRSISSVSGEGVEGFEQLLPEGKTGVLLGSSGVGKSTLLNCLLDEEKMRTNAVRESDHKGRHTTTHRELAETPWGAFFIDTPGMREVGLWASEEALGETFDEIAALEGQCRFSNCRHVDEPGCAVLAAVQSGDVREERLENYQRLKAEVASTALRKNEHERRKKEKSFGKMVKNFKKIKRQR